MSGPWRRTPGRLTFVQRFGSSLNFNIHPHVLMLDGVYGHGWRSTHLRGVDPPPTTSCGT
ncbi:MAG TPA: hypothetical protein EYM39_10755 [Candidatus Latescibacteria bacterium]|nr:hypothetical protein [Candidatus Latescibacterota bacterium]